MRSKIMSLLTVLGAVTVLVLAANTVALAATGKGFLLGKANSANQLTTLTRTTPGTALQVRTKSTANAPLAVNGKGKVANLNADALDGLDSSALKTRSYLFTQAVPDPTNSVSTYFTLPNGTYLVDYSAYLDGGKSDGYSYCYVESVHPGFLFSYVGESRHPVAASADPAHSGSGLITVVPGSTQRLFCYNSGGTFTTGDSQPIQIVATPTTVVKKTALRTAAHARTTKN